MILVPAAAGVFESFPFLRGFEGCLWLESSVFRAGFPCFLHSGYSSGGNICGGINIPVHCAMFGTDGDFVYGVGDFNAAKVAYLRGVSRVHGNYPATVLGNVVGEPLNKLTPIPSAVLHRISNPAKVFNSNHSIVVKVR